MTSDYGDTRLPDRFWDKVEVVAEASTYPGPCWIWTRSATSGGYGTWAYPLRSDKSTSHRIAWTCLVADIPAGLQIDHLCRVTFCCNPDHLEPVTAKVNVLRSESPAAVAARRSTCVRGHPYSEKNTRIVAQGHRRCKECEKANAATQRSSRSPQQIEKDRLESQIRGKLWFANLSDEDRAARRRRNKINQRRYYERKMERQKRDQ